MFKFEFSIIFAVFAASVVTALPYNPSSVVYPSNGLGSEGHVSTVLTSDGEKSTTTTIASGDYEVTTAVITIASMEPGHSEAGNSGVVFTTPPPRQTSTADFPCGTPEVTTIYVTRTVVASSPEPTQTTSEVIFETSEVTGSGQETSNISFARHPTSVTSSAGHITSDISSAGQATSDKSFIAYATSSAADEIYESSSLPSKSSATGSGTGFPTHRPSHSPKVYRA